jgi:hypothetical protein
MTKLQATLRFEDGCSLVGVLPLNGDEVTFPFENAAGKKLKVKIDTTKIKPLGSDIGWYQDILEVHFGKSVPEKKSE